MKVDDLRRLVARNIRSFAKARGMTLIALADFAGISRSQLFASLKGDRGGSLKYIAKIARVLDVEPWQLLHPHPDPSTIRKSRS